MRNTARAVSAAAVSAVLTVTCWLAGGPAAGVSTSASTVAVLADGPEDSSDNSNWG